MPKMKTQKTAVGRFHVTGSGKLMRTKCGKSHLRRNRSHRARELYDNTLPVSPADRRRIQRLLPYGTK